MAKKGQFTALSEVEREYLTKLASCQRNIKDLVKLLEKKFNKTFNRENVYYYINSRGLPMKRTKSYTKRKTSRVRKTVSDSKQFNLTKGKIYRVRMLNLLNDPIEPEVYETNKNYLRFLYATDSLLVFKHKEGFLETFPRNNNIVKVVEVKVVRKHDDNI